jgi:predicted RNA methylase
VTPLAVLARKLRVARTLAGGGIDALRRDGIAAAVHYGATTMSDWFRQRRAPSKAATPNAVDREHGTDTSASVRLHGLDIASSNYRYAVYYHPTRLRILREIFDNLPIRHEDYTFIDIGSGKGLVLLTAATHPFRRVIGVEFARELHEIAERNFEMYPKELLKAPIELVLADAIEFEPPPGNLVLFMFEPFERSLSRRFIERVERFAADRELLVAYVWSNNPRLSSKAIWEQASFLTRVASGDGWVIYAGSPSASKASHAIPIWGGEAPEPGRD